VTGLDIQPAEKFVTAGFVIGLDFQPAEKFATAGFVTGLGFQPAEKVVTAGFVTGHDFSRADKLRKVNAGFSPCANIALTSDSFLSDPRAIEGRHHATFSSFSACTAMDLPHTGQVPS
jgi:hypothetical protein